MYYIFKIANKIYYHRLNGEDFFIVTNNPHKSRKFETIGAALYHKENVLGDLYDTSTWELVLELFPNSRLDEDLVLQSEELEYRRLNDESNRESMALDSWMEVQDNILRTSEDKEPDDFESGLMRDLENGDGEVHGI